jgi:RimJ/RimL family protein N-acetyltransferase
MAFSDHQLMHFETVDKHGNPFLIRDAAVEDAAALIELLRAVAEEPNKIMRMPDEMPKTVEEEEMFIKKMRRTGHSFLAVAVHNGQIVAIAGLHGHPGYRMRHTCEMGISVASQVRGLGIGKAMTHYVIERARHIGITKIKLQVYTTNEPAFKLYETTGFEVVGRLKNEVRLNNGDFDDIYMMERLL